MKRVRIQKIIAVLLAAVSMAALKPIKSEAAWIQDSRGWWNTEGESWSIGWKMIDGQWYYFDEDGYMKTGWIKDKFNWYYLNDNGSMAKDTSIDGYDLNSEGIWIQKRSSMEKADENETAAMKESMHNNLIISGLDKDDKGFMTAFNIKDGSDKPLIKDRDVSITGGLSNNGYEAVYVDVSGERDPWQVYLRNLITNQTIQVTHDNKGKVNAKIADDGSIYFDILGKNMVFKIAKANPETGSYEIIDNDDKDRQVDCFDIKNNKLIISTDSSDLEDETRDEEKPICHTIFEADLNGENLKEITKVESSGIDFISGNSDGTQIVMVGEKMNGDSGCGIYKIDTATGKVDTIINDEILKDMKGGMIDKILYNCLAVISKDNKLVYFTGSAKDSEDVKIAGINGHPMSVFSYNMDTKEIKEVFRPKKISLIFDLSINY